MRRGGRGAAAPPAFGQLSFLGSGGPFFGQEQWWEGGCFSIFRRADDVTQTMSKGGGACEIPPFRKSCIRACYLCKILGNQPLRPPLTKAFPYAYVYEPPAPSESWIRACLKYFQFVFRLVTRHLAAYTLSVHVGWGRSPGRADRVSAGPVVSNSEPLSPRYGSRECYP